MTLRRHLNSIAAALGVAALACAAPAAAQMQTIDPNSQIDADLEPGYQPGAQDDGVTYSPTPPVGASQDAPLPATDAPDAPAAPAWSDPAPSAGQATVTAAAEDDTVYAEDDLIGAAEGVFGKGAEGVARMIENLLEKQGKPNAYIVGREAGGAFIVGARYGSGTLFHKVEGQKPVYWTGPSIGFDAGANAAQTFVLVYNLYDTDELYERYPAGGGEAYVVGGMTASYLRKGDVVLIPIRVGAGLRLGINAGYMKFSKEQRWLPF